ncbi:MAG: hypothetical protein R3202_06070 [Candidatus Competibacterales bacterium]|nr:hypothetical protein [Candidatus Competibacterales bacterium]
MKVLLAIFTALALTLLVAGGLIYFARELWPLLPVWGKVTVAVALMLGVIGSPLYGLIRWAERRRPEDDGPA